MVTQQVVFGLFLAVAIVLPVWVNTSKRNERYGEVLSRKESVGLARFVLNAAALCLSFVLVCGGTLALVGIALWRIAGVLAR